MIKANLGCGNTILSGWDNVDILYTDPANSPSWTVGMDVVDYVAGMPANMIEEVRAHHILEHIPDLERFMKELYTACANGAIIDIIVPVANTLWDVADPTHCRKFNHKTLQYYCKGFYTSYERPQYFEMLSQHIERGPNEWFEGIEWIVANLHAKLKVVK